MVDDKGSCFAVTVYNISQGNGVKIGDSVAIAEPFLQVVDVQYKEHVSVVRLMHCQCKSPGSPPPQADLGNSVI